MITIWKSGENFQSVCGWKIMLLSNFYVGDGKFEQIFGLISCSCVSENNIYCLVVLKMAMFEKYLLECDIVLENR